MSAPTGCLYPYLSSALFDVPFSLISSDARCYTLTDRIKYIIPFESSYTRLNYFVIQLIVLPDLTKIIKKKLN